MDHFRSSERLGDLGEYRAPVIPLDPEFLEAELEEDQMPASQPCNRLYYVGTPLESGCLYQQYL